MHISTMTELKPNKCIKNIMFIVVHYLMHSQYAKQTVGYSPEQNSIGNDLHDWSLYVLIVPVHKSN